MFQNDLHRIFISNIIFWKRKGEHVYKWIISSLFSINEKQKLLCFLFNKQIYKVFLSSSLFCYSIRSPLSFKSSSSWVRGEDIDEEIVDDAGDWGEYWGDVGLQVFKLKFTFLINKNEEIPITWWTNYIWTIIWRCWTKIKVWKEKVNQMN